MLKRSDFIRSGLGLAGILTYHEAPAYIKSLIGGANTSILHDEGRKNPYITSGLVAMWDGEWNIGWGEHDSSTSSWVNLVNGSDLLALNYNKTSWGDNCLVMSKGEEDLSSVATSDKDFAFATNYSSHPHVQIEIVIRLTSRWSRYNSVAGGYKQSQLLFRTGITGAYAVHRGYAIHTTKLSDSDAYSTISVGRPDNELYSRYYYSGFGDFFEKKCSMSIDPISTTGIASINGNTYTYDTIVRDSSAGAKTSIGAISGEMYCIRVYSRPLTVDEVVHNYAIDSERFGL